MNVKAIVFDLDGTLLNTIEDLTDSLNFVLENFNFPKKTLEQVKYLVGNGVPKLIERAIPGGLNNNEYEKCLQLFKSYYKYNMFNKTVPYDGVIEMLQRLKTLGIKTAVVSNKFDAAVKDLCDKYFCGYIDLCLGENEQNGVRKKPAPDSVLKILDVFGIFKHDAIYVGDSDVDIQTAQNAGIECISVLWGFKDREFLLKNGAKIIISNPAEILKYL